MEPQLGCGGGQQPGSWAGAAPPPALLASLSSRPGTEPQPAIKAGDGVRCARGQELGTWLGAGPKQSGGGRGWMVLPLPPPPPHGAGLGLAMPPLRVCASHFGDLWSKLPKMFSVLYLLK